MNPMQRLPGSANHRGGSSWWLLPRLPLARVRTLGRRTPAMLCLACMLVACIAVASHVSAKADDITLGSLSYDGLIRLILSDSSSAIAARQDYELSVLRNSNSVKLWDPTVSVSGALDDYDVMKNTHDPSVALSMTNQAQVLGGTVTLEAGSTYLPTDRSVNLRNQLSVAFKRSLTTGGLDESLNGLKERLAQLQADKAYADQMSDLLVAGISGLSTVVSERNDLVVSAIKLELATFAKTVADEKYSHGIISASALAAAQDSVRDASKAYFDKLTSYRDKLWELSRNTGLTDITDPELDSHVDEARQIASQFLSAGALGGDESPTATRELLSTIRSLVFLPELPSGGIDRLYDESVSELTGENEIRELPAMEISLLSLEIERLTLEKSERDLGWHLDASVGASWADYRREQSGITQADDLNASVMVTFSKQLLGSSIEESRVELDVKRSRLEDQAKTVVPAFVRQLRNLQKSVEDKEYAQEAASESLAESTELWELTASNFAAGMATSADVVSAAVSLLQAESALKAAQIESIVAKLKYINAVGKSLKIGWMEAE